MKIMIVDDEKLLRNGFKNMTDWSAKGINIIGDALNGEDALEKLKTISPDIVITDIKMPIMDGVTLTKKIKELYPHILILVLSSHDDYDYVRESMKNGASDYLLKASIDIDDLCDTLKRITQDSQKTSLYNSKNINIESVKLDFSIDKTKIRNYLELQQYDVLKEYVSTILKLSSPIPVTYMQDILRELFFFIEYTLDTLGSIYKGLKDSKYTNSATVNSISTLQEAITWFNSTIDEIIKSNINHNKKHTEIIKRINTYIEENFATSISLSNIADKFFINKNYLCDIYKAETNSTINDYITTLRIDKSKELIRDTNLTLTQISYEIGYQNTSYFNRVFRKKTGISPSEYMKLYR